MHVLSFTQSLHLRTKCTDFAGSANHPNRRGALCGQPEIWLRPEHVPQRRHSALCGTAERGAAEPSSAGSSGGGGPPCAPIPSAGPYVRYACIGGARGYTAARVLQPRRRASPARAWKRCVT